MIARRLVHKFCLILTVLVSFLFCPSTFAVAAQELPPPFASPEAFLKTTLKTDDTSVEARGDLNGDGLADWAGVIHRARPDFGSTDQLYVLLRVAPSGYRLAEKSTEAEIPGMGCCWLEDLSIRNGSIYVQNNAKTCCTMEAVTHQFKLYKGKWRLVGVRIYNTDTDPESQMTTETDMNLLTGWVIETKTKDGRKPIPQRRRRRFSTHLLKDFDFLNQFGS